MRKRSIISKQEVRLECQKALRQLSKVQMYAKDKIVIQRLYQMICKENAQSIMAYLPLSIEIDIRPLIARLRQEGRKIYVPFMEGASFRLVKYRYPLYRKKFGVKEPKDSRQYRKKEIDVAIVPFIGVDVSGRRIGFGKGMYDRFFEKEARYIKKTILVSRRFCYSSVVVTDSYDVKADCMMVPKGTYKTD